MKGSRVLAVAGRTSGEWRTTPVNLLDLRRPPVPRRAPGRHGVGAEHPRRRRRGAAPREEGAGVHRDRDHRRPTPCPILREYLRRWKWEVGQFFDGTGPDSTDEQLLAIVGDHPVFEVIRTSRLCRRRSGRASSSPGPTPASARPRWPPASWRRCAGRGGRVGGGQGRPRLHRSRLPRPRHRPAGAQPRRLDVRRRRHRPARRPGRRRAPTCSSSRGSWACSTAPPTARRRRPPTSPRLLDAPVVLVVDAAAMSQSVAAVVHGFATFDAARARRRRHPQPGRQRRARDAAARRPRAARPARYSARCAATTRSTWRDRHLGLVPVAERPAEVGAALDRLAAVIARQCDLDADRAAWPPTAPPLTVADPPAPRPGPGGPGSPSPAARRSPSPTPTTSRRSRRRAPSSCRSIPLHDRRPARRPSTALVVGGGFPEVYGEALAANEPLLADVRRRGRRRPASRGPSAAACCGWPRPSTAGRWRAWSPPTPR